MIGEEELEVSGADSTSGPNANPCPICLGPIIEESYLEQCFHKFCYNCILRWSKTIANKQSCATPSLKCPLCKTDNFSVIFGYDGSSFQQHYFSKSLGNSSFFSEAHRYRLKCYYTGPGNLADKLNVSRYWNSHRYLRPSIFLHDWLRREIQAVMQEEDVDIIVHHLLGSIDSLRRGWLKNSSISSEMAREGFRAQVLQAVRPFLSGRTERFLNELELFLASGLNVDAFDDVYMKHLGWKGREESEDSQSQSQENAHVLPYLYMLDETSDVN